MANAHKKEEVQLVEQFILVVDIDWTLLGYFNQNMMANRIGVDAGQLEFPFHLGQDVFCLSYLESRGVVLFEEMYRNLFKEIGILHGLGVKVYILFVTYGLYKKDFFKAYLDFIGYSGMKEGRVGILNRSDFKRRSISDELQKFSPVKDYLPKFTILDSQLKKWGVIPLKNDLESGDVVLSESLSECLLKFSTSIIVIDDCKLHIDGYREYLDYLKRSTVDCNRKIVDGNFFLLEGVDQERGEGIIWEAVQEVKLLASRRIAISNSLFWASYKIPLALATILTTCVIYARLGRP